MENAATENQFALKPLPRVDGDEMLWTTELATVPSKSEPSFEISDAELHSELLEPDLEIPFSARFMIAPEPRIDDQAFQSRLRIENLDDDGLGPWPLGFSILWHAVILGIVVGFMQLSEVTNPFDKNMSEPIEVAFGLSANFGKSLPDGKVSDQKMEAEALKTIQQLPQLPKSLALEAATPAPVEDALGQPQGPGPTPVPTTVPTAVPTPKVVSSPAPSQVVDHVDPAAAKKMKLEELAKRLEKEQRAVGAKERAGTDKKTANDVFKRPTDIPVNPMGRDIPKAPPGLTQAGSLQGKVGMQIKSEYAHAAAMHMRKHWSLPDVMTFESKLEVVLGFDINGYGRILGRVRVVKGSGNARFDEEAMKALEAAGPFPDLPKEMGQKLSMRMKFSPNSINF
ncbi:TonB C-terminal domain-containing protein [bacterium]|nr:TonB C-terminal domain-containing protein [bacterium]